MNQSIQEINDICQTSGLRMVQLHGIEPYTLYQNIKLPVIKRLKMSQETTVEKLLHGINNYPCQAHLIDPGSGNGQIFNWHLLDGLILPRLIIAGGLNPENVKKAIKICQPWGIDACSGVELRPGQKDHNKMEQFIKEIRCQ